ncbi:MAG TPA: DUF2071 domain-containing protein [Acidimicrobiales bacterium]|nr:DUF2071 domain-containing protein [Acidimicrobiales bacterium]
MPVDVRADRRSPDHHIPVPAMLQRWAHTSFLHWPFAPEVVRPLVVDELDLDLHEGKAWVSLTPFVLQTRPVALIDSPETNVRTYVRGPDGRPGLWFLSLDAASPILALAGRALAPYWLGDLTVDPGKVVRYEGQRSAPFDDARYRIEVRPGRRLRDHEIDPLADWLTARWRANVKRGPALGVVGVEHEPWPLHRAEVTRLDETLLAAADLPDPQDDPVVHYADEVTVRLGWPRLVR